MEQDKWEKEFEEKFKPSFSGGDLHFWERAEPIMAFIGEKISQAKSQGRAEERSRIENGIEKLFENYVEVDIIGDLQQKINAIINNQKIV